MKAAKIFHLSAVVCFGLTLLFFTSCSNTQSPDSEDQLTENQEAAIQYFKEIALGFEFGDAAEVTRKWDGEMKIYVGGDPSQALSSELSDIISELNQLVSRSEFSIRTVKDSSACNAYLFFGSGQEFAQQFSDAEEHYQQNYGLFFVNWNSSNELNNMWSYVDIYRTEGPAVRKHLLREELTQSLGLAQDSGRYANSIFNISYSVTVTGYAEIDKHIIQLLYHPEIETGLNASEVDVKLREIISEVVPN